MGLCESKKANKNKVKNANQSQIGNKIPIKNVNPSRIENKIQNQTQIEQNQIQIENKIQNLNEKEKPELFTGHKPIPVKIVNEVLKSTCKIKITFKNNKTIFGRGFFMNINNSMKGLITNYHIINKHIINEDIEIEIYNNIKMKLNINNRDIKYYPEPEDITIIEIKNNDEIYKYIKFLDYDKNYKINGYKIYEGKEIFSIEYPLGHDAACASGRIINTNSYEFEYDIPIENGPSVRPIILLNDNIDLIQVIGIHKEEIYSKKLNSGTFIGELFNDNIDNINNKININNNYIIAEIDIKDDEIYKDMRIINSYEEYCRMWKIKDLKDEEKNEEEIKKCDISINNKLIEFNYYYRFQQKGKHIIKYSFNNYLIKTNYMFSHCESLTNIDLSNFNSQNVINMSDMFSFCESLTNINLSNLNTQNVTDMNHMFSNCISLTNIDLSNFNTQNVINMSDMFSDCESLKNINLSNFNTQNVTDMSWMFSGCESLKLLNLSNFNTQNVTNMSSMFYGCKSLVNVNLSNFNTQNVINMADMFYGCKSLYKKNIIIKNKEIIPEFYN